MQNKKDYLEKQKENLLNKKKEDKFFFDSTQKRPYFAILNAY
jgi:hypothetical protein